MEIWKALRHLYPQADPARDYEVRDDGTGAYIAAWRLPGQPPSAQQIADAILAYDAAATAEAQRREAVRALAKQRAAATVGIRFDQLTLAQLRDLLAVLFWRADALTATGHIRPLGQWARDVDEEV
jgi:hypothetical protein